MRNEVRQYRTELGRLTIDDPTRVHGVQVPTREGGWKWRIYFPPGGDYLLRCYQGIIPAGVDLSQRREWGTMNDGGTSFGGSSFQGEVIVEARFKQIGEHWVLQTSIDGGGWSDLRLGGDFAEYLANPRGGAFWTSNLNTNEQSAFAPDERIFLLKRRRPDVTKVPGGTSSRDPVGPAPGVALWIEQE